MPLRALALNSRAGRWPLAALLGVALLAAACSPSSTSTPARPGGAVPTAAAPAAAPAATTAPAAVPAAIAPAIAPAAGAAPAVPAQAARPAPLSPPVTLKVGMLRSGAELGMMIGMERGYYTEEGLDLQITDFTTAAAMIPPLATGELDIGNGGISVALFSAIARGLDLKIVANQVVNTLGSRSTGWVVRKALLDSGRVRTEADFKGLRVALGAQGTIIDVELDEILRRGNLTRDDIETIIIPYPDQVAAMANGAIDAAYSFEPTRTRLIQENLAGMFKYSGEVIEDHESTVVIYGPGMNGKREAGNRFMVAYLRAVRDAHREGLERPVPSDEVLDILVKHASLKDRDLWARIALSWTNPDGYNYPTSIERDLKWFVDAGLVPGSLRLADALDQSYVDYAIGRLGRYSR